MYNACIFKYVEEFDCNHRCPENCAKRTPEQLNPHTGIDHNQFYKSSQILLVRAISGVVRGIQYSFEEGKEGNKFMAQRRKKGHYHFIARDVESILRIIIGTKNYFFPSQHKVKFLDCGAGIGNVVMMAELAGFDAYGIEYDNKTIERGREFLKMFRVNPDKLIQGDLLKYKDFGEYDVLYGYCPLSDGKLEREFEMRMFIQMKIGAVATGLHPALVQRASETDVIYFQDVKLGEESYSIENVRKKVYHEKVKPTSEKARHS